MNGIETLKTAINSLRANKVRSVLTMLGVIIGVFAVVSLVAIGRGVQNYITDQFDALGSNLILVAPGKVDVGDDPAKSFSRNKLDDKHIELINTYVGNDVVAVTPSIRVGKSIDYKTNSFFGTVVGANEKVLDIFDFELSTGKFFSRAEVNDSARVVVLGNEVKNELFGLDTALDKKVKIGEDTFTVIGTIAAKNQNFDNNVYVPYTAAKESFGVKTFSSIATKAKAEKDIELVMKQVELALLRDMENDDFTVLSQQDIVGSIEDILGVLTAGLGAIAGISLVVGGIGIMNIMLVSVTERTKEIGLRKALGATSANIGTQFLIESVLLSVVGGMVGLFLGLLLTLGVQGVIRAELPLSAVVIAFVFSVVVGVVFGTYPAAAASKKNPIDALRYE